MTDRGMSQEELDEDARIRAEGVHDGLMASYPLTPVGLPAIPSLTSAMQHNGHICAVHNRPGCAICFIHGQNNPYRFPVDYYDGELALTLFADINMVIRNRREIIDKIRGSRAAELAAKKEMRSWRFACRVVSDPYRLAGIIIANAIGREKPVDTGQVKAWGMRRHTCEGIFKDDTKECVRCVVDASLDLAYAISEELLKPVEEALKHGENIAKEYREVYRRRHRHGKVLTRKERDAKAAAAREEVKAKRRQSYQD